MRYEVYFDKGRLFAADLDTGEKLRIIQDGRYLAVVSESMEEFETAPYEIFERDDELFLLDLKSGKTAEIILEPVEFE